MKGAREMGVLDAILARRSVRRFDRGRPVPDELVQAAVDAARWAPSSCNLQTWDFVVVRDEELRRSLAEECKSVLVAPVAVFVLYDRELAREGLANVQSAAAATMTLLLRATSLGLASLWVNAVGDRDRVRELLGAPPEMEVLALVCLGYAEGPPPPPPERRALEEVLHRDRYRGPGALPRSPDPDPWSPRELALYLKRKLESGTRYNKPNPAFFGPVLEVVARRLEERLGGSREPRVLDLLSNTGLFVEALARRFPSARFAVLETAAEAWFFAERRVGRPLEFVPFPAAECERILSSCAEPGREVRLRRESGGLPVMPRMLPRPPLAGEPFDAATCLFRLEGVPAALRGELLAEAHRRVRPGGTLLLAYVSSRSWHTPLYAVRRRLGRDTVETAPVPDPNLIGPFRPLSPREVSGLTRRAGWRVVREDRLHRLPDPRLLGAAGATRRGRAASLLRALDLSCRILSPIDPLFAPLARTRIACLERL